MRNEPAAASTCCGLNERNEADVLACPSKAATRDRAFALPKRAFRFAAHLWTGCCFVETPGTVLPVTSARLVGGFNLQDSSVGSQETG
jgi:hypothetical protein